MQKVQKESNKILSSSLNLTLISPLVLFKYKDLIVSLRLYELKYNAINIYLFQILEIKHAVTSRVSGLIIFNVELIKNKISLGTELLSKQFEVLVYVYILNI